MVAAGGEGGGGASGAEADGGEVVAELVGAVASWVGVAEAELAERVRAPTLDLVVVEECAGVVRPGCDGECGASGAEADGGEAVAHRADPVASGGGVAEAELARPVGAPALDGAVVEQGAGVVAAGAQGGGGAAGPELGDRLEVAEPSGDVTSVDRVVDAELAAAVAAPAVDVGRDHHAGVGPAGGEVTRRGGRRRRLVPVRRRWHRMVHRQGQCGHQAEGGHPGDGSTSGPHEALPVGARCREGTPAEDRRRLPTIGEVAPCQARSGSAAPVVLTAGRGRR